LDRQVAREFRSALAEALQRAPNGGAIAVWASSSVTQSSSQAMVDHELFRLIFTGAYATLGEAVAAAKRAVAHPDLRRSLIFFGDPAMYLTAPRSAARRSPSRGLLRRPAARRRRTGLTPGRRAD
jgi:hypothetical protein